MPVLDAARDASRLPVLTGVQSRQVPDFWPHVSPMIAAGAESRRRSVDLDGIYRELVAGDRQLWLATSRERGIEALLMTQLLRGEDGGLICALKLAVGKEPARWLHFLRTIEEWAASRGCHLITTEWTRPSWQKHLPGYVLKRTRPDHCVWLDKELTI